MALSINNQNIGVNHSNRADKNNGPLSANLERMSTGKRINSAADDAARLAIAMRFATQISGTQQAYKNVNDGISLAQTAEAASSEISNNLQRIRELSVQSANATLNDNDRASLQAEVGQLQEEINRTTNSAEFNGISLLNNAQSLNFQVGPNSGDRISIDIPDVASQLNASGVQTADISTSAGASNTINAVDNALNSLSQTRSQFGATISRFETASRNLLNVEENLEASRSRLEDTDVARELSNFSVNSILNRSEIAMQSQANASQKTVLQLLS